MKKLLGLLLAVLLLTQSAAASTVFLPPVPASDTAEGLEALYFSVNIDEETSRVETTLLLKNPTGSDITAEMTLPTGSICAEEDALHLYLDGEPAEVKNGCFSVTVPANGCKTVEYRYVSADDLRNAKVISFDFAQLVFTEGAHIGKFEMNVHLAEESIPLVNDIQPVNYRYADRTVSFTLYDFAPSRLLDSAYIAKDTWKDLASSREFEPNAAERFVLAHYREWFADGYPVEPDSWSGASFGDLIEEELGVAEDADYSALYVHTDAFDHVISYLYDKEEKTYFNEPWTKWSTGSESLLGTESLCDPTTVDRLSTVVAVQFAEQPSLKGVQLWAEKTVDYGWNEEVGCYTNSATEKVTEQEAVRTQIPAHHYGRRAVLPSHVAQIPSDVSTQELKDYLDVIGASFFIRQLLYDNRNGGYPYNVSTYTVTEEDGTEHEEEYRYPYTALLGVTREEDLEIAYAAMPYYDADSEEHHYDAAVIRDPVLSELDIPAVVMYRGVTEQKDGKTMVRFTDGHYMNYCCGACYTPEVLASERGQELTAQAQLRRSERMSKIDVQIETMLTPAPAEQWPEPETEPTEETEAPTEETVPAAETEETEAPTEAPDIPKQKDIPVAALIAAAAGLGAVCAAVGIVLHKKRKGNKTE